MDLTRRLRRFAAAAPVPVFAVAGAGMRRDVQALRRNPGLRLVDTPRAAAILLLAGHVAEEHDQALAQVHDLVARPRATVIWRASRVPETLQNMDPTRVEDIDPEVAIRAVYGGLLAGHRPSEPALLPNLDPVPWRGVGPYGQGGTGMTGGTPYGRPMAEVAPDRDGLRLDVLPVETGPFFPRLPSGLVLEVKFAGDLVVDVEVVSASLGTGPGEPARHPRSPFVRALSEPVPIAELEVARAKDHLRWLADALLGQGLSALADRVLGVAQATGPGEGDRLRRFAGRLEWTQVFRWSLHRGGIDRGLIEGHGLGPLARAAGLREDLRLDDPAYRALGFEPIVLDDGGLVSRWRIRLAEAAQSLDLAAVAGGRATQPVGRVESPRGRLEHGDAPTSRLLRLVPDMLSGLEWGDAVATLISLDLDLDEADESIAVGVEAAA